MGTDIHGIFQRHDAGKFVDVPSTYDFGRHYQLFAVLADVRNGFGFAGIRTGEAVKPISEPRGLPSDFEMIDNETHPLSSVDSVAPWRRKYLKDGDALELWIGDHSHSWLTSTEMLAWYESSPSVIQCGVISRRSYDEWDKKTRPEIYSGNVFGKDVIVIEESEIGSSLPWTHVRIKWNSSLKEELAYFFDEVKRLHDQHGEVRFVFGFDS